MGVVFFLAAVAATSAAYLFLSLHDVTGLRGAWVATGLSEWGTGRGGYYVNEGRADGLLLGLFAAVTVGLAILLFLKRPKRRDWLQAGIVALAGVGTALLLMAWRNSDNLDCHPRAAQGPPEPRPDELKGHAGQVTSVVFSPDGRLVASGGEDHTVRLWDPAKPAELARLEGHEAEVLTVAFSPDGKILASGSVDKTIRLWNVASRREVALLKGHSNFVRALAFAPDGKTLASASWDKTVKLWDFSSRAERATLEGHTDAVKALAYSPDGKTLVSGGVDHTIRLWDVASRTPVKTLQGRGGFQSQVLSVAISPDGRWLVAAGDGGAAAWELPDCAELIDLNSYDQTWGAAFSADGKTLAVCSERGNAEVWTVTGGGLWQPSLRDGSVGRFVKGRAEVLFQRGPTFRTEGRRMYGVAFSPDGRTLATAGGSAGEDGPRVYGGMRTRTPEATGGLNLWNLK